MNENQHMQEILLFEAISQGDTENVRRMLASGINREIANEESQTPLHFAAKTGNLEITKLLLEEKSRKLNLSKFIIQRDKNGKTALHFAAEACAIGVIKYLRFWSKHQLDHIKDNKGFSALDCVRFIRTMRKMGDKKFSAEEMKKIDDTIKALISNPKLEKEIAQLQKFIQEENLVGVKELVAKNPGLLESRNEYTNTPLFEAIYSGKFAIANYFLEAGADVNARCFEGKTPLHRAVWVKDEKIILKLLDAGANIEALNDHEGSPLLDAVATPNNAVIIEILLKHGAKPDVCNGVKRNIIHLAAEGNCGDNIKYLFEKINDKKMFEQLDGFGRRPLHLAAERNYIKIIQLLIELGCKIDNEDEYGRTAFHLAAEKNCVEALECLLKLGSKMEAPDKYGRTPLHVAAYSGALAAAEYLLNNGAKLEATDSEKRTPLHLAARDGQLGAIKFLIEKKADLSKKDFNERTPLEVAKTHPDNYASKAELQKACDLLSSNSNLRNERWYPQSKDSQAPQRFHPQPRPEWKPKQSSKFDKPEEKFWRPKRP